MSEAFARAPEGWVPRRNRDAEGRSHHLKLRVERRKALTQVIWGIDDSFTPLEGGKGFFRLIADQVPNLRMHIFHQGAVHSFRGH